MPKPRKGRLDWSSTVPVVADGAIAGPPADGRLVPVLILDTRNRPQLRELIRIHKYFPPGDVRNQWGRSRDDEDHVFLLLDFVRPVEFDAAIPFSIERHAILVETILYSGAVYLQAGDTGDRLIKTWSSPRVLAEIADVGFRPVWDGLLLDRMSTVMARRLGVSRSKGRQHAQMVITEMKRLAHLRMRS